MAKVLLSLPPLGLTLPLPPDVRGDNVVTPVGIDPSFEKGKTKAVNFYASLLRIGEWQVVHLLLKQLNMLIQLKCTNLKNTMRHVFQIVMQVNVSY